MGGKAGGGAHLTPLGAKVLDAYRDMEQRTEKAFAPIVSRLNRLRTPDKRRNKG
jgi:molybdate transport repressor ModE-like protein